MEETLDKTEMSDDKRKYLEEIYYDLASNASFSGINTLLAKIKADRKFKVTQKELQKWLSSQHTYTAYKKLNRKFKRPKIVAILKDHQWELDAAVLSNLKKYNRNYGYFVLAIDVLTRYVWTVPLKTLKAEEMVTALKVITKDQKPVLARTDMGSEFISKKTKDFWKSIGVKHFVAYNETKCAMAERAIKTIKGKLMKYMHKTAKKKWVDALEPITSNYNDTKHRILGMSPSKARIYPEVELYMEQHFRVPTSTRAKKFKLNINDKVKISVLKSKFEREYSEKWSNEAFLVADRWFSQNIPMYKIKSMNNELIQGTFYEQELQFISLPDENTYIIESVLKERKIKGRKQYLVKWCGYSDKFNSWVNSEDIIDL